MAAPSKELRARLLADWRDWLEDDEAPALAFDGFSVRCVAGAPVASPAEVAGTAANPPPADAPPQPAMDLCNWACVVPGPVGTPWEGARLPLTLHFDKEYPAKPPVARFPAGFFHPNVFPSGKVWSPYLAAEVAKFVGGGSGGWPEGATWLPGTPVKVVLRLVRELLAAPNNLDAAQEAAWRVYGTSVSVYNDRVRLEAQKYGAPPQPPPAVPTLAADFGRLLDSGEGADVTLCCADGRVAAHSVVLCARSPVFRALLTGPLAADPAAVPVPAEVDARTLRRTLGFIYTDALTPEFASAEEAQHLLNAADVYALPRLLAACERALLDRLAVGNAAATLALAEQHGCGALRCAALRYVSAHAVAVMATPGWAHLKASCPALVDDVLHTAVAGAPPEPPPRARASTREEVQQPDQEGRRVRQRTCGGADE